MADLREMENTVGMAGKGFFNRILWAIMGWAALSLVAPVLAAPGQMNFQGRLTDSSSNPLTGSYSLTFSIFDASSGGTQLWTETQTVPVDNGIFSVALGPSTPLTPAIF